MRYLEKGDILAFQILNAATAVISLLTAFYLLPLVPSVLNQLDESQEIIRLSTETEESRRKLFTFMAFLCHEIRNV